MTLQDYDTILDSLGSLGPWHWRVLLSLIPPALLPGMWSVLFVFSGYVVPHRCRVPACDGPHTEYQQPWLNFTTPSEDDVWDSCSRFRQVNGTTGSEEVCEAERFLNLTEECGGDYVWDQSVFTSTVVTEWDLVCDGHHGQFMVDLGYTMNSVGFVLGVLIPGYFCDRFGRKKIIFFTTFVAAVSTLVSAFVPNYTSFLVVRVFNGFGTIGTFVTMCILAVEMTSVQHKSLVGNLVHILWAPGQMLMALMAYLIRDWRQLHIAVSIPIFLSLLLYPVTPESPRWLLAVGKEKEAERIIKQIARLHHKPVPALHRETELTEKKEQKIPPVKEKVSALIFISSPGIAITTAILCLNWLVVNLCYSGLSLNSVNLAGNLFVNFVLSALVEVPAVVMGMFGMDWLGRVTLLVLSQLVAGGSCILAGFLHPPYVLPLSLIGKLFNSIAFLILYLYTAEIYPTKLRGLGLALTGFTARLGGFVAPYIAGIGVTSSQTPFLIFGGSALLGGLAGPFLAETRGEKLPETVEDVEHIVLKRAKNWFKRSETTDL